jgi:hypothetical protein
MTSLEFGYGTGMRVKRLWRLVAVHISIYTASISLNGWLIHAM